MTPEPHPERQPVDIPEVARCPRCYHPIYARWGYKSGPGSVPHCVRCGWADARPEELDEEVGPLIDLGLYLRVDPPPPMCVDCSLFDCDATPEERRERKRTPCPVCGWCNNDW